MSYNYIDYHIESSKAKDIDPSNDCLKYLCDRFELNIEQRFWLAYTAPVILQQLYFICTMNSRITKTSM